MTRPISDANLKRLRAALVHGRIAAGPKELASLIARLDEAESMCKKADREVADQAELAGNYARISGELAVQVARLIAEVNTWPREGVLGAMYADRVWAVLASQEADRGTEDCVGKAEVAGIPVTRKWVGEQ